MRNLPGVSSSFLFDYIKVKLFFLKHVKTANSQKECFVFETPESVFLQNCNHFFTLRKYLHRISEVFVSQRIVGECFYGKRNYCSGVEQVSLSDYGSFRFAHFKDNKLSKGLEHTMNFADAFIQFVEIPDTERCGRSIKY